MSMSFFKFKRFNIIIRDCFAWNLLGLLIVYESEGTAYILSEGLLFFMDDLLDGEDEDIIRVKRGQGIPCMVLHVTRRWILCVPLRNPIPTVWSIS